MIDLDASDTQEAAFMDKMRNVTVPAWAFSDAYKAGLKCQAEIYNKLAQIGKCK